MKNSHQHQNQLAEDHFGLRVAAYLSDTVDNLPYEVSERLRAARVQALGKQRIAATLTATSVVTSGGAAMLTFGNERLNFKDRLVAALPLLALVLGLIAISVIQNDDRANDLADIDAALLTDDLPPTAYTDPGFALFLKQSGDQNQ